MSVVFEADSPDDFFEDWTLTLTANGDGLEIHILRGDGTYVDLTLTQARAMTRALVAAGFGDE